jgi:aerobic-type carbon monoxide dehydrogenase small subunit (CoxS/CutS family)
MVHIVQREQRTRERHVIAAPPAVPVQSLIVNGAQREVSVAADSPLLWVLRDQLGLLGAKFGCGLEQCGACTVLVDGMPRPSCRLPVADAAGREVRTVEALRDDPVGRLVFERLIATSSAQCGYCLPGIAVTLTWLASRVSVTWDEVLQALDGHLCRCGSHPRILRAARSLLTIDSAKA